MPGKLLKSIRWSITYIFIVPVIVCALIAWTAYIRINEFEASHVKIAQSTVSSLANEISDLIDNQQRLLKIFAKREDKLIYQLAQSPGDESLKSTLTKKLREFFPEFFAFTVTDYDGKPFLDDFEGLVGDLCINDIKAHAKGKHHLLRLHPNPHAYHIDFMVPWGVNKQLQREGYNDGGIFFVSFKPSFIANILKISSPARHELRLINKSIENLIEITEQGSRIKLKPGNFRLTAEEQKRALFTLPVKNTRWELTDYRDATLFSEYKNGIIKFSIIILFLFISGSAFIITMLLRSEQRRISAETIKEEMFSVFNHDLRSPLTVIDSFIQLMKDPSIVERKPEIYQRLVDSAYENTLVMRGMVDDILDIQKMDAGKMSFDLNYIELIAHVKKAIDMNQQYGDKHKVKLKFEAEVDEVVVNADSRRLNQAITNLLSNAIKYSPENETVTIRVTLDKNNAVISVSDNGPGIEEGFQALVFNKFAQSKSKLTRKVGGTGLGLSIVKHIIEAHRGLVTFESEFGKGTTFKIYLPTV